MHSCSPRLSAYISRLSQSQFRGHPYAAHVEHCPARRSASACENSYLSLPWSAWRSGPSNVEKEANGLCNRRSIGLQSKPSISSRLRKAFPGHASAEESGFQPGLGDGARYFLIIDPLDGHTKLYPLACRIMPCEHRLAE